MCWSLCFSEVTAVRIVQIRRMKYKEGIVRAEGHLAAKIERVGPYLFHKNTDPQIPAPR